MIEKKIHNKNENGTYLLKKSYFQNNNFYIAPTSIVK